MEYYCVNALNGLLLISTTSEELAAANTELCQCPQRASTYFYDKIRRKWIPY